MKTKLEELVNAEIVELNIIIDEQLKIPDAIFRLHGLSGFSIVVYGSLGAKDSQELEQAQLSFDALCNAVPNAPREAIRLISMAYALLGSIFDPRNTTYGGDLSTVESLMAASTIKGMAKGIISNDPKTSERDRKKMLSMAGLVGAKERHRHTAELKDWALGTAKKMRGAHIDIARQLAARVPAHLAEASKDSERLIYDALRLSAKQN